MSFLVLVPTRGTIFTEHQEALEREFRSQKQYPAIIRTDRLKLIDARNTLLLAAVKTPSWDYVVMVDDDIVLPEGSFSAFKERLDQGADVAVIDYPHHHHPLLSKTQPAGVTVFTQWLEGEDTSVKEVAWSGLGAVALKRSAFEKLTKSGFQFKRTAHPLNIDELGRVRLVTTEDKGIGGQAEDYSGGEDTDFFFSCRALDLKIRMVKDKVAAHLRMDHAVSWIADEKYSTSHVIERSDTIEVPGNKRHMEDLKHGSPEA